MFIFSFLRRIFRFFFVRHRIKTLITFIALGIWYWQCLPNVLFDAPRSMVLTDRNGALLGARIAEDGQWRFPHNDSVPYKFATAITTFEDKRFYKHWGVDFWSLARAVRDNFGQGRVTSGASTLTMQVMRMSRGNKSRNLWQKLIETIQATRLEWSYSKQEILAMYASNAPFGGNVVGLDAASWRYYGKQSSLLSWGEAATLAVLPNSPSLVHPGKNRNVLRKKRNFLLDKLYEQDKLDSLTCELAKAEPLPDKPIPLPKTAPHLLERAYQEHRRSRDQKNTLLHSSIDKNLQIQANLLIKNRLISLKANHIHNVAVIIGDIESNKILAYIGNTEDPEQKHGGYVDIIQSARSTGSILKPILYASMLNAGVLFPKTLVADIPMYNSGYRPENYYQNYDGVVAADRALIRSLNIPFIKMLEQYGLEKFHLQLQQMGVTTLKKGAKHYGLSLILGGSEAKLEDLTSIYANMAKRLLLKDSLDLSKSYAFQPLSFRQGIDNSSDNSSYQMNLHPMSIYLTFEAMRQLERPSSEGAWEFFESAKPIAWKTGTSFGFRDAWAIGLNPKYVVGVWVGNANGEGRPDLVGVKAAAPILFDLFNLLEGSEWFEKPTKDLSPYAVCKSSGYRASKYCTEQDTLLLHAEATHMQTCPYHQLIHLDPSEQYRVNSSCLSPNKMIHKTWFTLPPTEEHYYKTKHPTYQTIPAYMQGCQPDELDENPMQFIYPKKNTKIYLPVDYDGEVNESIFKITHRVPSKTVHWHLNHQYLGSTKDFHQIAVKADLGRHHLVLVDSDGNQLEEFFEFIQKMK
ncbi:MAG: penicillin-binding protein 1C [Saprospiraceae bacterium]|nr:penicillin-binding protein 1C [Saprospiraceae bacterium]